MSTHKKTKTAMEAVIESVKEPLEPQESEEVHEENPDDVIVKKEKKEKKEKREKSVKSSKEQLVPKTPAPVVNVIADRNIKRNRIMASKNSDLTDDRFKSIYNAVKDLIVGKQFNIRQFTILIPLAMQILSEVKTLTGDQKKETLIKVFRYIVQDMEFENLEQETLAAHFVENDMEVLIDTAYSASKGKFEFNDSSVSETYDSSKLDMIYAQVRGMIIDKTLDIKSIVILVPSIMMQVARFANITGLQKKELVVQLLQKLLGEFKPEGDTEQMVLLFVQNQLPHVIEVIYQASKGKYIFKKIQTATVSFWKKITPCLR